MPRRVADIVCSPETARFVPEATRARMPSIEVRDPLSPQNGCGPKNHRYDNVRAKRKLSIYTLMTLVVNLPCFPCIRTGKRGTLQYIHELVTVKYSRNVEEMLYHVGNLRRILIKENYIQIYINLHLISIVIKFIIKILLTLIKLIVTH